MTADRPISELKDAAARDMAALEGDGFAMRVLLTMNRRRQRRQIMIGSLGAIGSAVAGAQLTHLFGAVSTLPGAERLGAFADPEMIASCAVAGAVAIVAWAMPGRA